MSSQTLKNTRICCFSLLFFACVGSVRNQYISLIKYQLFTRNDRFPNQEIDMLFGWSYEDLNNSWATNFNVNNPTKIIVHGWQSGPDMEPLVSMKDNYLTQGDYNVIMMNWSAIAASDYVTAVASLRYVGFDLAKMVSMLRGEGVRDIHAIGFSLGAHVTGIAGYYLGRDKFNRITGLDPAKPFLINVPLEDKLDATDADFVDVYHTEMIVEGKNEKCGHVDFYVNWGGIQPGCENLNIVCSHIRAPIYFAESIISNIGFWGFPIDLLKLVQIRSPWILAGEYVDKNAFGSYYVGTNSHYPYAKGRSF